MVFAVFWRLYEGVVNIVNVVWQEFTGVWRRLTPYSHIMKTYALLWYRGFDNTAPMTHTIRSRAAGWKPAWENGSDW